MIDTYDSEGTTSVIECRQLWKIFGKRAAKAMRAIREQGLSKTEVRGVGREERCATARQALATVELDGWEECYPDELSGGMQQRVGLGL